MKRCFLAVCLALMMFVSSSCAQQVTYEKHQHFFFGTFDTIITLIAYTESAEEFQTYAKLAEAEMYRYHEIFDQHLLLCGCSKVSKWLPLVPESYLLSALF